MRKNEREKILSAIEKTKLILNEMENELNYQEEYEKVWDKAQKKAAKTSVSAWECLTWDEQEKYCSLGKSKTWFKRRAMIVREWMMNVYGG